MKKEKKFNKFSVPLGLLDYGNAIFYTGTMLTLINHITLASPYNIIFLIGAILSIVVGLIIPTGKVLVGLNIIKFKMPVGLVFLVNSGILVSGLMLLKYVFNINNFRLIELFILIIFILTLIYLKKNKFNTIAVLTGAFGYVMIYASLIYLSISNVVIIPIICYAIAVLFFLGLCGIGIKANLKDPKVHWVLESCNVTCQMLVMIGTIILFLN